MPQQTIQLLQHAQKTNSEDPHRRGNLICLPAEGRVIFTGDLHGHRRNFERIVTFADLKAHPNDHLILHEIIHGGPENEHGFCQSYQLLFDAIKLKIEFPQQVHFILGNHDTAFINNSEVMKNGKEMNVSMRKGLEQQYGASVEEVNMAIRQFLFSQPLAVKCPNRIWFSHSLPSDAYIQKFDPAIFNRQLKINDVVRPASAYLLTWGRKQSKQTIDTLAEQLDVDIFIVGHQAQPDGWARPLDNMIILASDHNHGVLLPIDLNQSYSTDALIEKIVPLASIA